MKPRQPPRRPPRGRRGKVPIPEDVWRESTRTTSAAPITAEGFENDGQGIEVQGVWGDVPARRALHLPALLRAGRGLLRPLEPRRRRRGAAPAHPVGPAEHLALRRLPARRGAARPLGAQVVTRRSADRLHAARERRPPGRGARPRRGLGQERHRQPDALVQGPRRVGRRCAGARARLRGSGLRLDRQPRQRRRRALLGAGPGVLRLHPLRPRGAEGPGDRDLRHDARQGPRQLRRRQPAVHRAVGREGGLGVRQRQPAPLLRRGLQDPGLRDLPSNSAGSCPTGSSRRSRRARCSRRSPRGSRSGRSSASSRASCRRSTAPRPPAARRSRRRSPTAPTSAARSSRTRSPSRWRSATRPTAPTRSTSRERPRARSRRSPTTRSAPASACSPRRPASSPRRPAA